jgi:hypothetical protein
MQVLRGISASHLAIPPSWRGTRRTDLKSSHLGYDAEVAAMIVRLIFDLGFIDDT